MDLNLPHARQSLVQGLSTIPENGDGSASRLALFAAMVEENARNARRLADAAALLVRASSRQERLREEPHSLSQWSGSSVDPPSSDQSTPVIMEGHRNYCNIL